MTPSETPQLLAEELPETPNMVSEVAERALKPLAATALAMTHTARLAAPVVAVVVSVTTALAVVVMTLALLAALAED
jgi:hypothetical protein